jgi:hypothetical protein
MQEKTKKAALRIKEILLIMKTGIKESNTGMMMESH